MYTNKMIVGLLSIEIYIPGSSSLKDKRMILKSLKDRAHKKFNVSVAEAGYQDKWQRSLLGFALVAEKEKFVQEALNKLFTWLDNEAAFEIVKYNFEFR